MRDYLRNKMNIGDKVAFAAKRGNVVELGVRYVVGDDRSSLHVILSKTIGGRGYKALAKRCIVINTLEDGR